MYIERAYHSRHSSCLRSKYPKSKRTFFTANRCFALKLLSKKSIQLSSHGYGSESLCASIKDIAQKKNTDYAAKINYLKSTPKSKISPRLNFSKAPTITLSNFGVTSSAFTPAPIIVPPTIAIIGIGKLREAVVVDQRQTPLYVKSSDFSFGRPWQSGPRGEKLLGSWLL